MLDSLICGGFWLLGALAAVVIYRRMYHNGYWTREYDPLVFDLDNPEDEYEYRCTIEQRRSGRERGPVIILQEREATNDD